MPLAESTGGNVPQLACLPPSFFPLLGHVVINFSLEKRVMAFWSI
jgi:hypothetical protein